MLNIHARAQALCKTRLHRDCTCKLGSSRPLSGKLLHEISLVVFEISNPSNGVHGRVGPPSNLCGHDAIISETESTLRRV